MKISTSQFFENATNQMGTVMSDLSKAQTQLTTGKKINQASDAPNLATSLQRIRSMISQQESYQTNLNTVKDRLSLQDATLRNVSGLLIRLKELSIQGANGVMGAKQRETLAVEVSGIKDQLLALANARDPNGNALFAGSRVQLDAYGANEDGEIVFMGDEVSNQAPVGEARSVNNRRSGASIFLSVVRGEGADATRVGFFQVIEDMANALKNNDRLAMERAISESDKLAEGVALAQAAVGADMTVAESQTRVLEEDLLRLRTLLSENQDVDYTEAITQMKKQMTALEAAQSSFSQISRMSLFSYLN